MKYKSDKINKIMSEIMDKDGDYQLIATNILSDKYNRDLIISEITFDWCRNYDRIINKYEQRALLYYFIASFKMQLYSKTSSYFRAYKKKQMSQTEFNDISVEYNIDDDMYVNELDGIEEIVIDIEDNFVNRELFFEYYLNNNNKITLRELGRKYDMHHVTIFNRIDETLKKVINKYKNK